MITRYAILLENDLPTLPNIDITEKALAPNGQQVAFRRTVRRQTGYNGVKQYDRFGHLIVHQLDYTRYRSQSTLSAGPNGSLTAQLYFLTWGDIPGQNLLSIEAKNAAVVRLYRKLANTNALLGVMFKERQKTVNLVTDKLVGIWRFWKRFKRFRGVGKLFKAYVSNPPGSAGSRDAFVAISSKWLEYRYGWLPLIIEVDNLLNKPLGLPNLKVEAGATLYGYYHKVYSPQNYHVDTAQYTCKCNIGGIVTPKDVTSKTLNQYGVAGPAATLSIWESIPFSFLADWALNIGGYLEHLGALSGLNVEQKWTSEQLYATRNWLYKNPVTYPYSRGNLSGRIGMRRLTWPPYPNPLVPSNGLNLTRAFDAVALLTTIASSLARRT